jgi:hypothetical protein
MPRPTAEAVTAHNGEVKTGATHSIRGGLHSYLYLDSYFSPKGSNMSNIKENLKEAGQKIADAAKNVGEKVSEKAVQAADWLQEKTGNNCGPDKGMYGIQERMSVIASCGKKVGVVDHLEGGAIKLTKNDSPDGQHHFIPMGWVDHVDNHVHLKKNSVETEREWKSDAMACLC